MLLVHGGPDVLPGFTRGTSNLEMLTRLGLNTPSDFLEKAKGRRGTNSPSVSDAIG